MARQKRVLVIGATQRDSGAVAAAFIAPPPACTTTVPKGDTAYCLQERGGGANNDGARHTGSALFVGRPLRRVATDVLLKKTKSERN